jgi:hypothetical protein
MMIARLWRGAVRPERAHYYPEDREFLLYLEPTVTHYEVDVAP